MDPQNAQFWFMGCDFNCREQLSEGMGRARIRHADRPAKQAAHCVSRNQRMKPSSPCANTNRYMNYKGQPTIEKQPLDRVKTNYDESSMLYA